MTQAVTGPLTGAEISDLLEGIGVQSTEAELETPWPIDGLLHPDLTVITGLPEVGKSTCLQSMLRSVLDGMPWMGRETSLPPTARVLIGCEDKGGEWRIRKLFPAECASGRVIPFRLTLWNGVILAPEKIRRHNVGLVVLDSVFSAIGDVNDQAAAPVFLANLHSFGVPVVVVHHFPSGGNRPAGAQMYRAAYRNTVKVSKVGSPASGNSIRMRIAVSGNDVAGESLTIDVDRVTLQASAVGAASTRAKRGHGSSKVADLAAMARDLGLASDTPLKTAAKRLIRDRPGPVAALWGGELPKVDALAAAITRAREEWILEASEGARRAA